MSAPNVDNGSFSWLKRHVPTAVGQKRYARELAMLAATAALHRALKAAGLSQKELAERLGKSKGFVSRALNGRGNLTVGTIADILWACGQEWRAVELRGLGVSEQPVASTAWESQIRDQLNAPYELRPPTRGPNSCSAFREFLGHLSESVHVSPAQVSAGAYEATAGPSERVSWYTFENTFGYKTVAPPSAAPAEESRRHLRLMQDAA